MSAAWQQQVDAKLTWLRTEVMGTRSLLASQGQMLAAMQAQLNALAAQTNTTQVSELETLALGLQLGLSELEATVNKAEQETVDMRLEVGEIKGRVSALESSSDSSDELTEGGQTESGSSAPTGCLVARWACATSQASTSPPECRLSTPSKAYRPPQKLRKTRLYPDGGSLFDRVA